MPHAPLHLSFCSPLPWVTPHGPNPRHQPIDRQHQPSPSLIRLGRRAQSPVFFRIAFRFYPTKTNSTKSCKFSSKSAIGISEPSKFPCHPLKPRSGIGNTLTTQDEWADLGKRADPKSVKPMCRPPPSERLPTQSRQRRRRQFKGWLQQRAARPLERRNANQQHHHHPRPGQQIGLEKVPPAVRRQTG
jgi:hypothetical protein